MSQEGSVDKFDKIYYNTNWVLVKTGGCSLSQERGLITMVTYEGIFTFVMMLTGVISLIYTIVNNKKK